MKDIAEQMNAVSLHENPAYYSWWQAPQATIIPTDSEGPIWDIKTLLHEINARHDDWVVDDCEIGPFPGSAIVESDVNCTDDDFEQLDMLGDGTRGIVHKVIEKRSGKIMARKTITTHDAPMKQLLRELQNISSNKHPNIVYFFGAYMSPSTGEIKILTEFCEGGSLDAVCKEIKKLGAVVGEMVVARIAEGVLQGLAYLHSRKTIHRDIKPSNILLSFDGIVKLCDFGASGELVGSLAGTFIGTAMYMAPERISGADYTIRSDVWSMGISLLELAQNRFPFPNDVAPIELIMHITRGTPPTLEDEPGITWSDEIKDFIKHALTHDQAIRPAPKEMLVHPWIVYAMKKDVHMAKWVRQLWKGKKIKKRCVSTCKECDRF
ncbi:kinase-like domain-containing protein [Amanita rubescens]|nr:kinase-like domain-containing protein [Amanita rubescens]